MCRMKRILTHRVALFSNEQIRRGSTVLGTRGHGALILILLCLLIYIPKSWSETPAEYLLSACRSAVADESDTCDGYIDGAVVIWKYWTACHFPARAERSFCAGIEASQKKHQEVFAMCHDCKYDQFGSEEKFRDRMQRFRDEMKAALGICVPSDEHDQHYCDGYNAESENEVADLTVTYDGTGPAKLLGRGAAVSDVGMHLFASEEFLKTRPCLPPATDSKQIKDILLRFTEENPEQGQHTTAVMLLGKALYYKLCPGVPERLHPNSEHCTDWRYYNGQFGARNNCDRPVVVQFMTQSDQVATVRELKPDETFRTGLSPDQVNKGWYIYAACPAGYITSVPFGPQAREEIGNSEYYCVKE